MNAPLVWRLVERHLGRHLPPDQLAPVLGDLIEDFDDRVRSTGRARAELWLVRESLSLARAYRLQARHLRGSKRTLMDKILIDECRLALRRILKRPGASLVSIVTLACSIGAGAATWSLLNQVLLHPLPIAAPDRLVVVGVQRSSGDSRVGASTSSSHVYPTIQKVRDSGVFERVAAGGAPGQSWTELVGTDGSPQRRGVYYTSHDYFDTLGVRLALGSGFRPEDDQRGAALTAVISDRYWRLGFSADPNVVGRTITVAGKPATIVGVTPRGFRGLNLAEAPDVFLPLHVVADISGSAMNFFAEPMGGVVRSSPTAWIAIVGRLRQGLDARQSGERLNSALTGEGGRGSTYVLTDVNTAAIPEAARAGMAQFTQLLTITVGLLVFIGCLTVGMLLLIRTEARRDEFAMCLALGATRGRLARGVAIEGALLSLVGAALAVPVAWWLFAGVKTFQLPGGVNIEFLDLAIDGRVLAAAIVVAIAATLVISLVAGAFGFSANIADVLRSRAGATPRLTRRRTRAALVTAQVAVALVLLSGAGLFARSLTAALGLNPGFDTAHIASGSLTLSGYGYSPVGANAFFDELRDRLAHKPAIRSVGMLQQEGAMGSGGKVVVDGVPRECPSAVWHTAVDDRYFQTIGLGIRQGRGFATTDTAGASPVIVVSESFGRLIANGGNPVGHHIKAWWQPPAQLEIVGVVPDVITRVSVLEPLVMYFPIAQATMHTGRTFVVRATADMSLAMKETMDTIKQMDPAIVPPPMLTMDESIGRQMGPQRFGVTVLAALGVIAALLTVLGTYVLAESMASMRKREIGIRAALGATRSQLGGLVLSETARLVGLGLATGLVLSWLLGSLIQAFLFKVEPLDPLTLAVVSGSILMLALAVSLKPAIGAARVNLARVLREE